MAFTSNTTDLISNFYKILTGSEPSDEITVAVRSVDTGEKSLTDILTSIYSSPSRTNGGAEEIAKIFLTVLDRVPDYPTYLAAINMHKGGQSIAQIANLALQIPGKQYSDDGMKDNTTFVQKIYSDVVGSAINVKLLTEAVYLLNRGEITRGDVVNYVINQPSAAYVNQLAKKAEVALTYLAINRSHPTNTELTTALTKDFTSTAKDVLASSPLEWPKLNFSSTTINETDVNDGSIKEKSLFFSLDGANFSSSAADTILKQLQTSIPKGITSKIVSKDNSFIEISLSGKAAKHDSSVSSKFSITFTDKDFSGIKAEQVFGKDTSIETKFYDFFSNLAGNSISLSGEISSTLKINLDTPSLILGSSKEINTNIKGSILSLSGSDLSNLSNFDMGLLTGKGAVEFTSTGNKNIIYQASNNGDKIITGSGNDKITGGLGNDTIFVGSGADSITGGLGNDTFKFNNHNAYIDSNSHITITDYGIGKDSLDFSQLLGYTKAPKPGTPIVIYKTAAQNITNGSVYIIEANGRWESGNIPIAPKHNDIQGLFVGNGITADDVFNNPTGALRSVLITTDIRRQEADIWLIQNDKDINNISTDEIHLIGTVQSGSGSWNVLLNNPFTIV